MSSYVLSLANQLTYMDASRACSSDILLFFINYTTWDKVTPLSVYLPQLQWKFQNKLQQT